MNPLYANLPVTVFEVMSQLARELVMDRSTLTRNLRPLISAGLLDLTTGNDAREKHVQLKAKGRKALAGALPPAIAVPSCSRSVHEAAIASGVKQSMPSISNDHASQPSFSLAMTACVSM